MRGGPYRAGNGTFPRHKPGNPSVIPVSRANGVMMLKRFIVVIGMLLFTVGGPGSAAGAANVAAGASAAAATKGS